jgi:5'-nucleotidase
MHLLLTNDDGIDAEGLAALEAAVSDLPDCRVSIVAPESEQSMCGHCVTTSRHLVVRRHGCERWAVAGPSADCVRVALFGLHLKPDWILSGVNAGGNMGQDLVISGTVAAAREAAYHGVKAMAFSHYLIEGIQVDWHRVAEWTRQVFDHLRMEPLGDAELWNVNFPHHPPGPRPLPDMRHCHPARSPLKVNYHTIPHAAGDDVHHFQYNASYAERPQDAGSDVEACFGGSVSISKIRL